MLKNILDLYNTDSTFYVCVHLFSVKPSNSTYIYKDNKTCAIDACTAQNANRNN